MFLVSTATLKYALIFLRHSHRCYIIAWLYYLLSSVCASFDGLGSIARSQEYQKNKVKHVLSCLAGFLFIPHSLIVNMQTNCFSCFSVGSFLETI